MKKQGICLFVILLSMWLAGCGGAEEMESSVEEPAASEKAKEEDEVTEEIEEDLEEGEDQGEQNGEVDDIDQETEETPEVQLGDYEIYLGGEMVETEEVIQVHGESNLIPGSRIIGEVSAGEDKYFADTTELVQEDGTFYMEIPNHELEEETTVTVKFHFDGHQEDEIKRHYGERGQKLEGPYIYQHEGKVGGGSPQNIFQMAKVETAFEPSEELAVRQFKEPNWYPIPEDMGDPRVWIEVEEINHDNEYYYLHGRSNLLEGSKLSGKYSGKWTEASVKPDGSFDMVLEYEYDEDASFVIEFDPTHFTQWNIIQETYGAKGQKLVGELVVQNQFNDNQRIVKEEKLESNEISVPDNVELTMDGADVTMLVPDQLLFDFDEYVLKEESKEVLLEISETLKSFDKDIEIEISGHTDSQGDEDYNLDLSEKRAEEVKNFLIEEGKVEDITFTTVGYGESKPIASNDTEAGQAKNRRVEIIINLR